MPDNLVNWNWPALWMGREPDLVGPMEIEVAGYLTQVLLPADEVRHVYFPVLHLLDRASRTTGRRVLAALAGIPGGGKSTFAAVLERVAAVVFGPGRLMIVGMDGWHWPNAVLDAKTTTDAGGRTVPLRRRKGGSESYDVASLASAIDELQRADGSVSLPVYDRRVHDPVPDGLTVPPDTRIVVIEGNFVLSSDPPWDQVSRRLHPRFFLDCPPATAREQTIHRHLRGGLTFDEACAKYDANDRLNTDAVEATRPNADFLISLFPYPSVSTV